MDCRKLMWLGGLAIAGLVGCSHRATIRDGDPYSAVSASGDRIKAPDSARPVPVQRSESSKDVSKVLDARPESCVKIGDLKAEIALDPNRSDADRALAVRQAKDAYNRALQLDPKHLSAWIGLARLHMWLNEYEPALSAYDAALAKYPKNASVWYERGMCMAREKKLDQSVPYLAKAAQLEPSNALYTKGLGLMLARLGRGDEAVRTLLKSLPEADARYNVARMMEHIGNQQESRRQLTLALKANPNHQPTLALMTGPSPEETATEPLVQTSHEERSAPIARAVDEQPSAPPKIVIGSELPR